MSTGPETTRLAARMRRVTASAIMETLKVTAAGDYISFASGLPDPALFPAEDLRDCADRVLTRHGAAALQYGPAEGLPELRDWIAQRLRARGLSVSADNILITNGSQQALDLAARALLDPDDVVCLESPTYLAALQTFDSFEARYAAAPVDDDGVDAEELIGRLADDAARLAFLLPNFQNPTGVTLTLSRRQRIADAAARSHTPVLEDDAYYDLRYGGEPLPPLAALADNPSALYTGTFSKTIAPGVRVGWICGQKELIGRLTQLKQITDLHTGSLSQRIVLEYLTRDLLDTQIERLCSAYRQRRDAMLAALDAHLPDGAARTSPEGGMFVLLTLSPEQDAGVVLQRALSRGVACILGAPFHPDGRGDNTLRLNFVSETEDRIRAGVAILCDCLS